MSDLYHQQLLQEAKQPEFKGKLDQADQVVDHTNASCGDQTTIYIRYDSDRKKILDLSWTGNGCIISQAAMSTIARLVKGKSVVFIKNLTPQTVLTELGLTEIAPGRRACLTLGLTALHKALEDDVQEKIAKTK